MIQGISNGGKQDDDLMNFMKVMMSKPIDEKRARELKVLGQSLKENII